MKPLPQPTKENVRAARERVKLTQTQAAAVVHLSGQSRWAEYENGTRNIDVARWELFLFKTGQHPCSMLINGMVVMPVNA